MQNKDSGTYLGFMVGPGKLSQSWNKALAKASDRVHLWQRGPLGLFFATQTWNTFVASTVSCPSE